MHEVKSMCIVGNLTVLYGNEILFFLYLFLKFLSFVFYSQNENTIFFLSLFWIYIHASMWMCANPFHIAFQTLKHTHTLQPHFREYIRTIFFYYPASHEKLMKTFTRFVHFIRSLARLLVLSFVRSFAFAFCISPLMKDNQKSIHTPAEVGHV